MDTPIASPIPTRFDDSAIVPASIDRVGVAANDLSGHTHVITLKAGGVVASDDHH